MPHGDDVPGFQLNQHIFPNAGQVLSNRPPEAVNIVEIDGRPVVRPRPDAKLAFAAEMSEVLRSVSNPGPIEDETRVAELTQALFARCQAIVDETLQNIACIDLLEFVMFQHDAWLFGREALRRGDLQPEVASLVSELEPDALMALQYSAEKIVQGWLGALPSATDGDRMLWYSRLLLAAEFAVQMSLSVDHLRIWPGQMSMCIEDDERLVATWQRTPDLEARVLAHARRNEAEEEEAKRHGPLHRLLEAEPLEELYGSLDPILLEHLGFSLSQVTQCVGLMRRCETRRGVVVVRAEELEARLGQAVEIAPGMVRRLLSGFMLRTEDLAGRLVEPWKSRRRIRLLRRPIVHVAAPQEPLLIWAPEALRQSWGWWLEQMSFGDMPDEWRTASMDKSLQQRARRADNRWVEQLRAALEPTGFTCVPHVKKLRIAAGTVHVPADVGEIDLLGWESASSSLVVLEVKRTAPTYTPRQHEDELKKYVRADKAYVEQCSRKAAWVAENVGPVLEHLLASQVIDPSTTCAQGVRYGIVTKRESYASIADTDVPIVGAYRLLRERDAGRCPLATRLLA